MVQRRGDEGRNRGLDQTEEGNDDDDDDDDDERRRRRRRTKENMVTYEHA